MRRKNLLLVAMSVLATLFLCGHTLMAWTAASHQATVRGITSKAVPPLVSDLSSDHSEQAPACSMAETPGTPPGPEPVTCSGCHGPCDNGTGIGCCPVHSCCPGQLVCTPNHTCICQ